METLILTGWGWNDYAVAAALALRHFQKADILGISTRRLPEFLNEVSGYKEIVIIGIGLTGNTELLAKALLKKKGKGVRVSWISCIPVPEFLDETICSNLDIFVDGRGITDAVSCRYDMPYDDLKPFIPQVSAKEMTSYHFLLEAAMYSYRNYQDEKSYGLAIKHLARKDPESTWSSSEKQLVEHYKRYGNRELVGKSAAIQKLLGQINMVANHPDVRVLIFGESGTGKETVALQIHNKSSRNREPFIAFNCASVTPNRLEDRFFGHEKGAFTGANEQRPGLFEQADGGTLFLDEIGELPLEAQGILLRVLEGGRFTRMGGKDEIEVDVRLLCATNRDLAAMVRDGQFREDLFHRLNVVQIVVPPLRKHKEDIRDIANGYFLKRKQHRLEPEQIEALMSYDYPGNVRELINLLERSCVLGITDFAGMIRDHKETTASLTAKQEEDVSDDLDNAIRTHVRRVYEKYNNNLSRAAIALNAARNTVKKYLD